VWPFTATITSPACSPVELAGVLQNTPPTSAPEVAGAMLLGTGAPWSLDRHWPLELTPSLLALAIFCS
jgi:hypothetical protein